MAALPYMPFFVNDYLADTSHLTPAEHGAYLLLILNYWQRGKPPPDDDKRLASLVRVSVDEWQTIRPGIEEFFAISVEMGWFHNKVDHELKIVRGKSAKAKASAKSRWNKDNNANAERTQCNTFRDAMPSRLDKARSKNLSSDENAVRVSPNDPHLNDSIPIEIRQLYGEAGLDVLRFENPLVNLDVELDAAWNWVWDFKKEKRPSEQMLMITGFIQNKQKKLALVQETISSKQARREAGDNGDGPAGVSSALLSSKLMQGARA